MGNLLLQIFVGPFMWLVGRFAGQREADGPERAGGGRLCVGLAGNCARFDLLDASDCGLGVLVDHMKTKLATIAWLASREQWLLWTALAFSGVEVICAVASKL